ncbi:hypothetical protein PGT21_016617 [Puccinia graminis f. sp. tritici]|uniref:Uncharacterized protein n=1 Tax=Puccinia graminis f. sp. tritici TaxID=56615 RepID=A0A5B0PUD7_PUCGR|nr:hypothetical protein PGT21_016617 [Puccinia graminis f. sp. tritici]
MAEVPGEKRELGSKQGCALQDLPGGGHMSNYLLTLWLASPAERRWNTAWLVILGGNLATCQWLLIETAPPWTTPTYTTIRNAHTNQEFSVIEHHVLPYLTNPFALWEVVALPPGGDLLS